MLTNVTAHVKPMLQNAPLKQNPDYLAVDHVDHQVQMDRMVFEGNKDQQDMQELSGSKVFLVIEVHKALQDQKG